MAESSPQYSEQVLGLLARYSGNMWFQLGVFGFDLLQRIFNFPDPLTEFIQVFSGRATMDATKALAGVLNQYESPGIRFLALGAGDLMSKDIPISSPDAAPIYGPYFKAALLVEQGIRWSRADASTEQVEDNTLSAAQGEAANPGVRGTATLRAIEHDYLRFQQGDFPGGSSPLPYFTNLAQRPGNDPATLMAKAWADQYVGNINQPPPTPTPPPTGQNPITVSIQQHQTVKGTMHLLGYAIPTIKNLVWLVDFVQVLSGFSGDWNSNSVADGAHTLTINGQDASGHVAASLTITFQVNNHGAPTGTGNVQLNIPYGQSVSGVTDFAITLQGGPYPNAHLEFQLNGQPAGSIADGTPDLGAHTYHWHYDTRQKPDGLYQLDIQWRGEKGLLHGELGSAIAFDNKGGGGGGNGGNGGIPPPPVIPWQDWFKICAEEPNCQHISNDYLALAQAVSNIAYAVYNLPHLWKQTPPDPCCDKVILAFSTLTSQIHASLLNLAQQPSPAVLEAPIKEVASALESINKVLGGLNPDFSGLDKALAPLKEIADKLDADCCNKIVEQLKRWNDDQQVPEDWKTALIKSKSIPAELVPLLQSTIWDTIASTTGAALGHALGWGEAEIEAAAGKMGKFVFYPVIHFVVTLVEDFIKGFDPQGLPVLHDLGTLAVRIGKAVDSVVTTLFGGAANLAIEWYEAGLTAIDTTTEEGTARATELLLGRALELGFAAHGLAVGLEIPFFNKHIEFGELAAFVAEMAGFREVLVNTHRPLMYTKLGRPAGYVYNRKFRTALPAPGAAFTWWGRRLLSDADAKHVAASAGFADHWDAPMFHAAYHPISPRALATLMQDQPFDRVKMREILQDNSYSPDHVDFMLDELEYASTKNVRNSYVSEAITAYQKGVMPDQELNAILEDLGWSGQAKKFVHERALLARRVILAQKVETQVTQLVAQGLMTPETGLHQMEAAGIQDWYANLEITLATTKAELIAARKAATEEHRAELARQRNLTHAAVAEYEAGRIDTTGLSAALKLVGLEPTLSASIVAVEEAKRAGRLKFTHGQLLKPEDSAVLAERVAAIAQQVKDQLIGLPAARAQLEALKVPKDEEHALIARWAANLKKTPGAAVLVNPLTGELETHVTG